MLHIYKYHSVLFLIRTSYNIKIKNKYIYIDKHIPYNMKHNNFELFAGKNLNDLFKDIYNNQINKKVKISKLIDDVSGKVRHAGDIAVLGVIIKDLIETSVKNDEHLLKLAQIAQRIITAESKRDEDDGFLSDAEKKQLLESLKETKEQMMKDASVEDIEKNIDNVK